MPPLTLYNGRPTDTEQRAPKEIAVYDFLDGLGIEYCRVDHEAAFTMDACADIDRILGTEMCKNLFLTNSQCNRFYLLLMPGAKKFKTKTFSKLIGSSRLSFAPEDAMIKYLGITPGSVSITGLINDIGGDVTLYVDSDVLKHDYIGFHPSVNTSSLRAKTSDMCGKFVTATHHTLNVVELPWEE